MAIEVQLRPASSRLPRIVTGFGFLLLYIPLFSLVVYSFLSTSGGPGAPREWTLEWYRKLASNDLVLDAFKIEYIRRRLEHAGVDASGTAAAIALTRTAFREDGSSMRSITFL